MYHEIHRCSPPSGQLPSLRSMLTTRLAQAIASVFAALYRSTGGSAVYDRIDMPTLLTTHGLYLSLLEDIIICEPSAKPLDINQAWIIARDMRTGAACFQECRDCLIRYIYTKESAWRPVARSAP